MKVADEVEKEVANDFEHNWLVAARGSRVLNAVLQDSGLSYRKSARQAEGLAALVDRAHIDESIRRLINEIAQA